MNKIKAILFTLFVIFAASISSSAAEAQTFKVGENDIVISPIGVYKPSAIYWADALHLHGVSGKTWIGSSPGNGTEDFKHKRQLRDTIIFAPDNINYNKEVEFIFFFHGLGGFGKHDFNIRLANNIKNLVAQKRNFILIIPEMPWSQNTATPDGRQRLAWSGVEGVEDFKTFYQCVMITINEIFSPVVFANRNTVTLIGHSAGGGALKQAALSGALNFVKPDKIVFSDADYVDYTSVVWKKYIKNNPNCELIILVRKGDKPYKKTMKFLKRFKKKRPKTVKLKVFPRNYSHKKIGDECLKWSNI